VSFVDLWGTLRSKLVPLANINAIAKEGAGFAGFATHLDLTPDRADLFAMADPSSLITLPWNREIGWLAGDLVIDGKPLEHGPRQVLRRQIEKAKALGYTFKTGVECEFFLLSDKAHKIGDESDTNPKPCYEQQALYRRFGFIKEVLDSMTELGWKPTQVDHEDANGQFEMNWEYDDCLISADRHVFFKFMVKSLAEKHGYRATFMPKPFTDQTGTGTHVHVSLHDLKGANLFRQEDNPETLGMNPLSYQFIGGVMQQAGAMCSLYCPTVNSYKRLAPVTPRSGSTWSPNTISYTGNNRTHMIRIPAPGRFELRVPDGAVNPYILPAAVLAAGLWGIETKADPGKRLDINLYATSSDSPLLKDIQRLPTTLVDAIKLTKDSEVVAKILGEDFVHGFIKFQERAWREYLNHLSEWEIENTVNC